MMMMGDVRINTKKLVVDGDAGCYDSNDQPSN
jgi:hypothetical protein